MGQSSSKLDLQQILESYNDGLKLVSKRQKLLSEESTRRIKTDRKALSLVEDKLRKSRSKAKKENSKQKKRIEETRLILDELMLKCRDFEVTQFNLERKISKYTDSLFSVQNSYQEMDRLAKNARLEFEGFSKDLKEAKQHKKQVELETSSYTKKSRKLYDKLRAQNKTQQNRFNFLKKRVGDIENLNKDLSSQNYKLKKIYDKISQKINENQIFEKQYTREMRHLCVDIDQKRIRYESLSNLVSKLQHDYKSLCRLHERKQDEFSKSSKKKLAIFHETSRRVVELKKKESKTTLRFHRLERNCHDLDINIIEQKRKLNLLTEQSDIAEQELKNTLSRIRKYKDQKSEFVRDCTIVENRLKKSRAKKQEIITKSKVQLKKIRLESQNLESKISKNMILVRRVESKKYQYINRLDDLKKETITREAELSSLNLIYQERLVRNRDLEIEYKTKLSEFSVFENNSYENLKKFIAHKKSETQKQARETLESSRREGEMLMINARTQASSHLQDYKEEAEAMKSQLIAEGRKDSAKRLDEASNEFEDWKAKLQSQIKEIITQHEGLSEADRSSLNFKIDGLRTEQEDKPEKVYFFSKSRRVHQFWMSCSVAIVLFVAVMGTKIFFPETFSSAQRGIASIVLDQNGEVFDEVIRIAEEKRERKYFTFSKSSSLQRTQWENTVSNKKFVKVWINDNEFDESFIRELADFFSYVLKIDDMNSVEVLKLEKSHIRQIQSLTRRILVEDKNKIIEKLKKIEALHIIELTKLLGDDFALSNYLKFKRRFYLDFNS